MLDFRRKLTRVLNDPRVIWQNCHDT
eukprot:SAG11_NODE_25812_length_353_cov_1.413386_2_plen_25_part_01